MSGKLVQPHKNTAGIRDATVGELAVAPEEGDETELPEAEPKDKPSKSDRKPDWDSFFRNLRRGKK